MHFCVIFSLIKAALKGKSNNAEKFFCNFNVGGEILKKSVLKSAIAIFSSFLILIMVVNNGTVPQAVTSNVVKTNIKDKISNFSYEIIEGYFKNGNSEESTNNSSAENENNAEELVYIGGFPIGIKLYCDGVIVVDTQNVETSGEFLNPAQKAGIVKGDIIKSIDGTRVSTNSEVSKIIEASNGKPLKIEILRNNQIKTVTFSSVYSTVAGQYKAGLWIRDSSAGIGTVTFYTKEGEFASLGHAVCDVDTGELLPILSGETTSAKITGCYKGKSGSAGELCGLLESDSTGKIFYNKSIGIYGVFNKVDTTKSLYPLCRKNEIKMGAAQIITTVENGKQEAFNVEIERIDYGSKENKNLVIKVVDENLIAKTGGIIQGMSGSPIIQNGKLIGAVTHVFLNDPTGGYGIFAETMLDVANGLNEMKIAS